MEARDTTGGKPMREDGGGTFPRCPHCAERPAAGHHLCPLNLEGDGCECCGVCAKICSDIRNHIVLHTPSIFVDYGMGEMLVTYIDESPEPDAEDDTGDDAGDFGLSA